MVFYVLHYFTHLFCCTYCISWHILNSFTDLSYYSQSDSAVDFNVANTSSSSSSSSSSDDEDTANGTPEVNGDDNTSDNGKLHS